MRISDWSSDVCSSDLVRPPIGEKQIALVIQPTIVSDCLVATLRATRSGADIVIGFARPCVRPQEHLADLTGREFASISVQDADAAIERASYRAAMRPPLAAIKDRVPLALLTSIDLPNKTGRASCGESVGKTVYT